MKIHVHGKGHLATITKEFLKNERELDECELSEADLVWACEDVEGRDGQQVIQEIDYLADQKPDALYLISSQLPVGTIRKLEKRHPKTRFACCPENFKMTDAANAYLLQDRFVVGIRRLEDNVVLDELFDFSGVVIWMSIESAEMVKHAINAYLGLCIAFINEIAEICQVVDADVNAVAQGLRTDRRVSPSAPLNPGLPFGGGHIDRDLNYLRELHRTELIEAIYESNHSRRR